MPLRIALAQIDFNPAFSAQGHDYLAEPDGGADAPAELFALEQDLYGRSTQPAVAAAAKLVSWGASLRAAYLNMLTKKLRRILSVAKDHDVDVLVFPEYAIPCALLREFHELGMHIIGGTHT